MTLIRKDLYNDLIAVRTSLQDQLADGTSNVNEKEAKVKQMEDFIAAFDKTQSDLDDSVADLQNIISSSEDDLIWLSSDELLAKTEIISNKNKIIPATNKGFLYDSITSFMLLAFTCFAD